MSETYKKLAIQYSTSNWSFSSARAWEAVIQADPSAQNLMAYAEQLRLTGQFTKALIQLDRVNPDSIPKASQHLLPLRRGMIYQDSGRLSEAISAFEEMIAFRPEETYPYVFLAVALSNQERLDEASKVLKTALQKRGDLDEVWYNLGLIQARMKQWKQAISSMQVCLKLCPDFPHARTWLDDLEHLTQKASGNLADDQALPGATLDLT
ncbi:MAG TPA: tetratricopeptide repeat protein [Saprospiraceae bacterium]|nr:tetratricopeptide repeat protein [Saprospiraceae bacterium]